MLRCGRFLQQISYPVIQHSQGDHLVAHPLRTWNAEVLHVSEQVEFFHGARNGVRCYLTHDMCGVYAVAGIALTVVDVVVDAPNRRNPVEHDANLATPLEVDPNVFQLRIYFEHSGQDVRFDAGRVSIGVVAGAAVKQAFIGL